MVILVVDRNIAHVVKDCLIDVVDSKSTTTCFYLCVSQCIHIRSGLEMQSFFPVIVHGRSSSAAFVSLTARFVKGFSSVDPSRDFRLLLFDIKYL